MWWQIPAGGLQVRSLGADEVWDYADGPESLKALPPFDLVFDPIGGSLLDSAVAALRPGGVVTHIRNRDTAGADSRYGEAIKRGEPGALSRFEVTMCQPNGAQLQHLAALFDEGKLSVKVARELPLERAGEAHGEVISGHAGGKVVLLF